MGRANAICDMGRANTTCEYDMQRRYGLRKYDMRYVNTPRE